MKPWKCEACRQAAVEIEFSDHQAARPYAVCGACEHRLRTRSLRPLEWFNLAAVHGGGKYLLHDDFYDEDGNAWQPEEEVDIPNGSGHRDWMMFEPTCLDWSIIA